MSLAGDHPTVIAWRKWQRQDALADIFKIYPHSLIRAFFLLPGGFFFACRAQTALAGPGITALDAAGLLVTLRRQRRLQVFAQDGNIPAARDRHLEAAHTAGEYRTNVGARGEIQIPAVPVERRERRVAHTIRNLMRLMGIERIYEDRMHVTRELARVRNPSAVRRPGRLKCRHVKLSPLVIGIGIDQNRLAVGQIQVPQVEPLVGIYNSPAVRRKARLVIEGTRLTEIKLARFSDAVLG